MGGIWAERSGVIQIGLEGVLLTSAFTSVAVAATTGSAALGLWLGGLTHGHGAWEDGGFYWQNAGFNGLGVCAGERSGVLRTMPRIFWDLVCVMGIARGCGLYSLDGQTLMDSAKLNARDPQSAWASSIWDDTGRTSDTFKRFVE